MANVNVTMIQKRMGEAGTYWDAGQTYSASKPFARALVYAGFATATFEDSKDGWDDLRFPAQSINPAGAAAAPAVDQDLAGFPGTLLFSGSQDNVVAGVAQMPHAWARESDIKPHIHWSKPVGSASAVSWVLYYRHLGFAGNVPGDLVGPVAGTLMAGDQSVSDQHLITSFGALDMEGERESACLSWQLHRLGSSDADSGTARLLEFDIHFISDKRGTEYEIPEA